MRTKSLLVTGLLSLCTFLALAQTDKSFKKITVTASRDTTFDNVIDYLLDKGIFIHSVDKQAGFIHANVFMKDKKFFRAKLGDRRTMNFVIRAIDNHTNVMLNIFSEEYYVSNSVHFYENKEIVDDPAVYLDILNQLQKAIDQKNSSFPSNPVL